MPELPEVETVRRDLDREIVGQRITAVRIHGHRTVRRQSVDEFIERMTSRTVVATRRAAKYLLVDLDDDRTMVTHLRMSGQLRIHECDDPNALHTHAWFDLSDDRQLRFVDIRTFGELFVMDAAELALHAASVANPGADPLTNWPTHAGFAALMASVNQPLKGALMNSTLIGGVGNIYSDEALHRAGLRHDRRTKSLSPNESGALSNAVVAVIAEGVEARGSSLRDATYVDLYGNTGTFAAQHRVYARAGEACLACGTEIVRATFQQRSTFWCPTCQP
jgi:formamidopyrimidine-DNA glycosylase